MRSRYYQPLLKNSMPYGYMLTVTFTPIFFTAFNHKYHNTCYCITYKN